MDSLGGSHACPHGFSPCDAWAAVSVPPSLLESLGALHVRCLDLVSNDENPIPRLHVPPPAISDHAAAASLDGTTSASVSGNAMPFLRKVQG
jgi:hypothetical protein